MTNEVSEECQDRYDADRWKFSALVKEKVLKKQLVVLFTARAEIPDTNAPKGAVALDELLDSFPESVAERLDRCLLNFERSSSRLGSPISIRNNDFAITFTQEGSEMMFVLRCLADAGLITGYLSHVPCSVILTAKGYERVADLNRGAYAQESQKAFVAMYFSHELEPAWTEGLKMGIEDCGFEAVRIDLLEHNGKICDAIIGEIRKSKFLVADFTGHRGGVYFEAGFMMGLGRPVIFTCREDELDQAHFDTRQYSHIKWTTPAELRERLRKRIEATIPLPH
jgi:nucleoside 2-deoxyribosyltransferase